MKHLIITGAYGLVGQNFIFPLNWVVTRIKFDEIPENCEMADYIIHGAGYGQPHKFLADEMATIRANTTLTEKLFSKLKPGGSFLFISTSEVYSGADSPYKETSIGTTTPAHPRASYIESKRCGEAICQAFRRKGYKVKIARLALAYGPGTKKGDNRVLHSIIEQALKGDIKLLDRGEAKRTYCYITDATKMMLNILMFGSDCVYNVGGRSEITIALLAEMIGDLTHRDIILGDKSLEGAPNDVKVDISKYEKEFGPVNFTSLLDGIIKTIEWQKTL